MSYRKSPVFGDNVEAKVDLSDAAITSHARLIIIRDAMASFDIYRAKTDHAKLSGHELEIVSTAYGALQHHLFLYGEMLKPVLYPAERRRQGADERGEFHVGDLEITEPDPEMAALLAETEQPEEVL